MDISLVSILRGVIGIAVVVSIAFLFSENKSKIPWKIVGIGLLFQIVLAFLILNPFGVSFLEYFRGNFSKKQKEQEKIGFFEKS